MTLADPHQPVRSSDDFIVCRREARNFALLFVVQTVVMIGVFLTFGFWRTDDPFGFPLGLPTWFILGVVIPAIAFLIISVIMALRMTEVEVK